MTFRVKFGVLCVFEGVLATAGYHTGHEITCERQGKLDKFAPTPPSFGSTGLKKCYFWLFVKTDTMEAKIDLFGSKFVRLGQLRSPRKMPF